MIVFFIYLFEISSVLYTKAVLLNSRLQLVKSVQLNLYRFNVVQVQISFLAKIEIFFQNRKYLHGIT
jgi:hypothetical protein